MTKATYGSAITNKSERYTSQSFADYSAAAPLSGMAWQFHSFVVQQNKHWGGRYFAHAPAQTPHTAKDVVRGTALPAPQLLPSHFKIKCDTHTQHIYHLERRARQPFVVLQKRCQRKHTSGSTHQCIHSHMCSFHLHTHTSSQPPERLKQHLNVWSHLKTK